MAGSLNRVTLVGHLGKDPDIRSMNSGDRVANFSVATSESWKDKNSGEKKEQTEWHGIVIWGPLVEIVEKYLHKGDKVLIEGKLQTRKWADKDGNDRWSTEIVLRGFDSKLLMLSTKGDGQGSDRGSSSRSSGQTAGSGYGYDQGGGSSGQDNRGNPRESFSADLDDEIPFISRESIW